MNSFTSEAASYEVKIYIAGDITMIKHFCQHHCAEGACVTVTPTEYVYTGGREAGAIIGLINYPRFPKTPADIDSEAETMTVASAGSDERGERAGSARGVRLRGRMRWPPSGMGEGEWSCPCPNARGARAVFRSGNGSRPPTSAQGARGRPGGHPGRYARRGQHPPPHRHQGWTLRRRRCGAVDAVVLGLERGLHLERGAKERLRLCLVPPVRSRPRFGTNVP
jgi:hypothetical protein